MKRPSVEEMSFAVLSQRSVYLTSENFADELLRYQREL